jgi:hypothetical protein
VIAARWTAALAIGMLSLVVLCPGCATDSVSEAGPRAKIDPGAEWFVQTGCTSCHSISVYGITNLVVNAPDLSIAAEDVQRRFGRPLHDFLQKPTGTMAMVLSGRIVLSESQRQIAVRKLEEAYARLQQQRGVDRPVSSH